LPDSELQSLGRGALLHDIGRIGIPRNVLLKPGQLSDDEREVMSSHPTIGHHLLSQFPELTREAEIVYCHHEKYDGAGYPQGLKGDKIPRRARLFSIVDTFDAITSDRPYRLAQSIAAAREEIARMAGAQFDPQIVREFLEIPPMDLEHIQRCYPDAAGEEE
jgi:HD-GYP domain-containing protein (c-di-GMP phosphodiesterase class II)